MTRGDTLIMEKCEKQIESGNLTTCLEDSMATGWAQGKDSRIGESKLDVRVQTTIEIS